MAASDQPRFVAQNVRFCRTDDGVRLAWSRHGSGPPVLIVSCWLSHLQHDWQSPVWRHFLDDLGEIATVIRYDERGFGLSEWDVADFSLQRRLADLEALVEDAGLDRFAVLGMSGGAPVALAYAHAHAERVTRACVVRRDGSRRPAAERRGGRGGLPRDDPRGLGATGSAVPPGVHECIHSRRHRGADAVDGRAAADLHQHRERRLQPDRPPSGRRHRPLRSTRRI